MTSDLLFMYKNFEAKASLLPNWKDMTVTELANLYCDADEIGETDDMEIYLSALMCKYWYMVTYNYQKCKSSTNNEITEYVSWLYEALMLGFHYRRWRDPNFKVYHLEDGAKTVFNRCIDTIRLRKYCEMNRNTNKVNYGGNNVSFDSLLDEYGDVVEKWADDEDTTATSDSFKKDKSEEVVDYYLNRRRVLSALIVEGICYQDTSTEMSEKKTVIEDGKEVEKSRVVETVSEKKLFHFISNIDDGFLNGFIDHYHTDSAMVKKYATYMKHLPKDILKSEFANSLDEIKNNREVRNILCC